MQNSKTVSSNSTASKPTKCGNSPASLGARHPSNSSMLSRRTDLDSEDSPGKLKNKFTKPRMNRMTDLRIQQLQKTQANLTNDDKPTALLKKIKKKESTAANQSSEIGGVEVASCSLATTAQSFSPTPLNLPADLENMRSNLADLQTEFIAKLKQFRNDDHNITCKLLSLVQDDNCQLVLQKDDLIAFSNNIPAQSIGDLKSLCREALYNGYNIMLEKLTPNMDHLSVTAERTMLQKRMDKELDNVNRELDKLVCGAKETSNSSILMQRNTDLQIRIDNLLTINSKMESEIAKLRTANEEFQKSLEENDGKNQDLAIELANKNIEVSELAHVEDDLRTEIQQLKKINKINQQRLKDTGNQKHSQTDCINKLETELKQLQIDKELLTRKSEELAEVIAAKDHMLADLEKQVKELVQFKDEHLEMMQSSTQETDQNQIKDLQAKLAVNQCRLESVVQQEQQLREEMEQKKELMSKMKLKVNRLEETLEYHRQMLAVRGERINYLDREMKQREQENTRKLNEITNELASSSEQFQNICATLSIKQTKLHSQEHVIKLLEESNDRSVMLHTKLSEKNALLKDELDHIRRNVKTLMSGNGVNDTEVSDILTE